MQFPASACCAIPHLNAPEIFRLLLTRPSVESPAALFMCERQTLEKVWNQLCGYSPECLKIAFVPEMLLYCLN